MSLVVLNDVHIGASRSAGTTPITQWELRKSLISGFGLLMPPPGNDLMILGDLFDGPNVPIYDVLKTFEILSKWLTASGADDLLYMVAGNHDLSKTSSVLSSFEFLCKLLTQVHGGKVTVIQGGGVSTAYGYVIPHVANQDLFDLELTRVDPLATNLFLHCNYDNNFAKQSDQSLNLSKEQAEALPVSRIIIAHEHYARQSGKVILPGNQLASSVSDWLGQGDKGYLIVEDNDDLSRVTCGIKADNFIEMPWTATELTNHPFVRVVGDALPDQSSLVISTINKLRAKHPALVITNAVKIQSQDTDTAAFEQSLESVQAFSVWDALGEMFTEPEMAILRECATKDNLC